MNFGGGGGEVKNRGGSPVTPLTQTHPPWNIPGKLIRYLATDIIISRTTGHISTVFSNFL